MDGYSKDIVKEDIEKLKSIFPQCVVEGKVKIDQLLNILGEYDERDFEKYEFTWKGKNECYKVARERTRATLLPCESESINFNDTKNIYIEGDNLEVLKILQQGYYNKIKMIYIDPPYNTGNDFVYKDNYKDSLANYKNIVSSTGKSNPETSGRFHTDWLNMMFPRLMLAHTLLKDDGVIFISIDDNEVDNLKKMCNEIFGENNFVGQIAIVTGANQSGEGVFIQKNIEYCLCFAKKIDSLTLNRVDKTEETFRNLNDAPTPLETRLDMGYTIYYNEYTKDMIPKFDYYKEKVKCNILNEVYYNDEELISLGYIPIRPEMRNGKLHRWRWGIETFNKRKNDIVIFKNNGKFIPKFKQTGFNPPKNIQNFTGGAIELKSLFKEQGIFSYPKNVKYIKYLISIGLINKDEIILDFFSGSATTAHAVMQLNAEDGGNRKYIMVQLPQLCDEKTEAYKNGYKNICEIGKERIRRAGAKIKEGMENTENLDTGFRVFKLDSTNFNRWDVPLFEDIDINEYLNNTKEIVDDRTEVDAMFEILIKNGFPLTEKIYSLDINNYKFYHIGEDCLVLVSFEKNIPIDVIEQAIEYLPAKLILTMDAFEDTSAMVTAKHIINKDYSIQFEILGENNI